MRFLPILVFACCLTASVPSLPAQDESADRDFTIQGEYSGQRNSMQVLAMGDGEFQIIVYDRPIDQIFHAIDPPRRLEGDEDVVVELAESLGVQRVQRTSPTLGARPPADAVVLFDGSEQSLAQWVDGKRSAEGDLQQGTQTKQTFRDYTLHLEFRTPWMPKATGQGRGNSGVYHQGRYETQILDSFALTGQANETGGIYGVKAPDVNACLPPMQWQTYDIDFTAARYQMNNGQTDNGQTNQKISDARLTVRLNGIMVQNDVAVPSATTAAAYAEGPDDGPIILQDHRNEVRFRNIWLVPRDAAREASRPIVPGYERFFANQDDPHALGGELLISTLGCVACHDGAESVLSIKKGPSLNEVRSRVRGDALVDMIADPHKTKPGTTMPDPWMGLNTDQRRAAAESIASYLMLTGNPAEPLDRPARSSAVKRGDKLYHSVGCVACHAAFDGRTTPAATTVPLGKLESKYTVDALANLIAAPHQVRSGGRMPALVGSLSDAHAIASYLTRAVTERPNNGTFRRLIYKGQWESLPDFSALVPISEDRVATLNVRDKGDPTNTAMVFEGLIRISVAGRYRFSIASDDGSRLIVGSETIDNDGIHPVVTRSESVDLPPGDHPVRIEWFNAAGGYDLDVFVQDPLLGRVALQELLVDPEEPTGPLIANRFQPNPNSVAAGAQLFQTAGCASCHPFASLPAGNRTIAELSQVRPDQGCLARSVSRPAVDFHLSPQQRRSIEHALELRRSSRSTAESISDADRVHVTLAGMNCYACHQRSGRGGPETVRDSAFQTTTVEMGWESRLPPALDGVGDKLKASYLTEILANGADERGYMLTRMPGFGAGHLDRLQQSLLRIDRDQDPVGPGVKDHPTEAAEWNQESSATPAAISDGRKLIGGGGLSCIKCHSYNNVKGGGIGVIDLLAMPNRLRADWFDRYLQDPTKYRPGTRMPNSFPDGVSSFTKLYDGDPAKQIAAMRAYLAVGRSAKEPDGLRAGAILLAATDRPRFYRNFFDGVSGRGIAVGFPAEVNLIWDAERMGLNAIWKHEFVDAATHWIGRGQGRIQPAGDSVERIETWTPIVAADSLDVSWPDPAIRDPNLRFRGYRLDQAGNPTFVYSVLGAEVHDAIRPADGNGFLRRITIERNTNDMQLGLVWRIAASRIIERSGNGFRIGNVHHEIDGAPCHIVTVDDQMELRALLPAGESVSVTQSIRW